MKNLNKKLTKSELEEILGQPKIRRSLAFHSHQWFFSLYLHHYLQHEFADFHKDFFRITEDQTSPLSVVVAFRGSGKSTILSLSYPLWSIVGKQQQKFVLLLCQTQQQAKMHLHNIRKELESNELLRRDIGPFQSAEDQWGSSSIVLSKHNARITVASTEQSIRGIRHREYRPGLVILDDVEDLASVKTHESREKVNAWFRGEVVPATAQNRKIIMVGNYLHDDCLITKTKRQLESQGKHQCVIWVPLLDNQKTIAWPASYPSMLSVNQQKHLVNNNSTWHREYLLQLIPDDGQVIHQEWIKYYDTINWKNVSAIVVAVDLAISEKSTADYTAMVPFAIDNTGSYTKIFVLPSIVNKRLNFPKTIHTIQRLSESLGGEDFDVEFLIESVGYQGALSQQLIELGIRAQEIKIGSVDKKTKVSLTSDLVKKGVILFPRSGSEKLINQLVNFGSERHDDLADAFSLPIGFFTENYLRYPGDDLDEPEMTKPAVYKRMGGQLVDLSRPITAGLFNRAL